MRRRTEFRRHYLARLFAPLLAAALLSTTVTAAPESLELKQKQADKEEELSQLNSEMNSLDEELSSYIGQIREIRKEEAALTKDISESEATSKVQYASMKDRIRFMYESGSVSWLEMLFESESMGDFLNKAYYISAISNYDRKMLSKLETTTEKIESERNKLTEKRLKLEELQSYRLEKQEELAEEISSAKAELAAARKAYQKASAAEKAEAEKKLETAKSNVEKVSSSGKNGTASTPKKAADSGNNSSWSGEKLTPSAGTIQGPSGKETYYNMEMSGVVNIMRSMGNKDKYWVRSDGVKMLGDYVMVAANLNLRPRGSLVQCSLGMAIVCDTGGFAAGNPTQLDIAVNW